MRLLLALISLLPLSAADPARIRIVTSNLTSGSSQSYDAGHGARILKGLKPDIALMQEFNVGDNSDRAVRQFVTSTFGAEFSYFREPAGPGRIPNGIVTRFRIRASGVWDDQAVSNREWVFARLDIPGPRDLWVVSVHLLTNDNLRPDEARALAGIVQKNVPEADYLAIGGDFNTDSMSDRTFTQLRSVVEIPTAIPADQARKTGTNADRSKPYDHVLADRDLQPLTAPVVIGSTKFPNGLVFDSRVFHPLSAVAPVQRTDSAAANMQHMAVVRDFLLPVPNRPDGLYTEIQTSKGTIIARLEMDLTPMTVANFVGLAEGTIANDAFDPGLPFFDGTTFHRVVPGHVIQGGVPKSGRARGPGYSFPNEIHASLNHGRAGMMNMANSGPHTNSSQFCFMLGDRSYLDGNYTVFGEAVEGLDVVMRIAQGDTVERVRILRVGAKAEAFRPTTESFRAMVQQAQKRVAEHVEKKRDAERAWIARNHPKAAGPSDGVLTEQLAPATTTASPGAPRRVRYRGTALRYVGMIAGREGPPLEETAFASTDNGGPNNLDPQPFLFEPDKTKINSGFDQAIASMSPGERRILIVPAAQAYGRPGIYAPETPGRKRFVISPDTMLVYDVEILPN